jgi:hypothetical protein
MDATIVIRPLRARPVERKIEVFSFLTDISLVKIRMDPDATTDERTIAITLRKVYSPNALTPKYLVTRATVMIPAINSDPLAAKENREFLVIRAAACGIFVSNF